MMFESPMRKAVAARPRHQGGWTATLKLQAVVLGSLLTLQWIVELADRIFLGGWLDSLGIQPRSAIGLRGIPLAPFIHANLDHLIANTMPLVVLGWLVMLRGLSTFFRVTVIVAFVSGLGVWCTARSSNVQLGSSGLIFGYLGYLILRGYFDRSAFSVAISVLVGVFYGSLIWGVLPITQAASWEGHLWGFVAGMLCAWLLTRQPRTILEIRI
jgi:membrane associated rhomboid family serine protease